MDNVLVAVVVTICIGLLVQTWLSSMQKNNSDDKKRIEVTVPVAKAVAEEPPTPRLLFLNSCQGAASPVNRLKDIRNLIKQCNPNVIVLSELIDWTEEKLATFADSVRFSHTSFFKTDAGFHMAMLSKHPIQIRDKILEKPFHHGLIVAETMQTVFMITHLHLLSPTLRIREIEKIIELERAQYGDKPVALVGTLNSLSQVDQLQYDQDGVVHKIEGDGPLSARKFLCESGMGPDGRPTFACDFRCIETLLEEGDFSDTVQEQQNHTISTNGKASRKLARYPKNCKLRIDYILVNSTFRDFWDTYETKVIRGPLAEQCSDHYPLIMSVARCPEDGT